jgi:hypothetical protein
VPDMTHNTGSIGRGQQELFTVSDVVIFFAGAIRAALFVGWSIWLSVR